QCRNILIGVMGSQYLHGRTFYIAAQIQQAEGSALIQIASAPYHNGKQRASSRIPSCTTVLLTFISSDSSRLEG
ncbi:MAG: hypothetical protein ACI3W5_10920, partial [Faecousia sp.]